MTTEQQTAGTPPAANNSPAAPTSMLTDDAAPPAVPAQATQDAPTPQPTTPPVEGETPPADAKPAEEAKPQGAPEAYVEFKAPEGVKFDPEAMTEFSALAKDLNLTQEQAQQVVDLGPKLMQKWQATQATQIEQAQAQWAESSRTDKEFGGDNLDVNLSTAKRALDTFGSAELSTMLKESGLGNHPEIIRAFYRVGKAISEDKLVTGTTRPAETDVARKLYPTMNN